MNIVQVTQSKRPIRFWKCTPWHYVDQDILYAYRIDLILISIYSDINSTISIWKEIDIQASMNMMFKPSILRTRLQSLAHKIYLHGVEPVEIFAWNDNPLLNSR